MKKAKNKTQKTQIFASQKSVIKDLIKLYDKITDIINTFVNNHIYPGNEE